MNYLIVCALGYLASSFVGYWVHRALHDERSGIFYRSHMKHHLVLYPPGKMVSEKYREPLWHERGFALFTVPFLVIVTCLFASVSLLNLPLGYACAITITILVQGTINDVVHDAFHLKRSWLNKLPLFKSMRVRHLVHHVDMSKNYDIVGSVWDLIFGTSSS